jgi:hypothetical protein
VLQRVVWLTLGKLRILSAAQQEVSKYTRDMISTLSEERVLLVVTIHR